MVVKHIYIAATMDTRNAVAMKISVIGPIATIFSALFRRIRLPARFRLTLTELHVFVLLRRHADHALHDSRRYVVSLVRSFPHEPTQPTRYPSL
jgi:hypothetical protein